MSASRFSRLVSVITAIWCRMVLHIEVCDCELKKHRALLRVPCRCAHFGVAEQAGPTPGELGLERQTQCVGPSRNVTQVHSVRSVKVLFHMFTACKPHVADDTVRPQLGSSRMVERPSFPSGLCSYEGGPSNQRQI